MHKMTLEALKLDILILKGYQMSNCFPKAMTFTKGQRNQPTISRQKKESEGSLRKKLYTQIIIELGQIITVLKRMILVHNNSL